MSQSVVSSAEQAIHAIAAEIKDKYPKIEFFELRGCRECKTSQRLFPVYDTITGMPTVKYLCTLFSIGDGQAEFLKTGSMPLPAEGIKDEGHGCYAVSVAPNLRNLDEAALREQLMDLAKQVSVRT